MKKFVLCTFLLTLLSFNKAFAHEEVLILIDSSLSMAENFKGSAKYKLAINETKNFLKDIPDSYYIGLRIIGIVIDENITNFLLSPELLCTATSLLVPIKQNNKYNIDTALNSIVPLGTTPLVYAVDTAIKYDFSYNASLRHIILITDGVDECNGNPCSYISELKRLRNDVKIDVIAIGVNSNEFNELKCFSDETSGHIININSPEELKSAFIQLLSPSYTPMPNNNNNEINYKNYMLEFYQ